MSDFDHNLRSYNEIRSSLRNICLWLLSEDKYTQHFHTKDKTFRESKKLIEAFLPKDFLLTKTMGHQTINYCRYDMFDRTEEYLAHTFQ